MAIVAGLLIGFLMQWWPFVVGVLFVVLFRRQLRTRVVVLFLSAVLIGYGSQLLIGYPMSLWSRAAAKVVFGSTFELSSGQELLIVYGSAALVTVLLVGLLAWQLGRTAREPSVGA